MLQSNVGADTPRAERVSAARAILETLARRGVSVAYGIPGGLISAVFDALVDVPEIAYVATRHEAMAGFAAMGHALATGRPALVLTTGGPGLTNTITAVASAFVEEVPMIVISGDVPSSSASRAALHDSSAGGLDGLALMRTVTRHAVRVDSAENVVSAIEQAFEVATGPRPGPVFISLPLDVANTATNDSRIAPSVPAPVPAPNEAACVEIALALAQAHRPLLVVGNGARGAVAEVRALAERLACPVVTTPHGKGVFPDSHPLHRGGIGFGGHESASEYIAAGPDVVLIVGSRLGDISTNGWRLPLNGTKSTFQIDRDGWLLGRNYPLTLGLVADAGAALREIVSALPADVARPLRAAVARKHAFEDRASSDLTPLAPGRVMRGLEAAFPDAFWAVDVGEHTAYAVHYLSIDRPERFRTMMGLASMGSGIGIALGAQQALEGETVVCVCGDGCFSMYAGELLTMVEARIPIVLAIMNDGRWNMVDKGLESTFRRRPGAMPSRIADFAGMAADAGAIAVRIESARDLNPTRLGLLRRTGKPVVLDIRFDASMALSTASRAATITRQVRGVRT